MTKSINEDSRSDEILKTHVVVLCIIEHEGRYALIQESKDYCRGQWHLPAGGAIKNETLDEAARREALEEAGIKVQPLGILKLQRLKAEGRGFEERWRFIVVVRPLSYDLKTEENEESICAAWYTLEEIKQLNLRDPDILNALNDYEKKAPLIPLPEEGLKV